MLCGIMCAVAEVSTPLLFEAEGYAVVSLPHTFYPLISRRPGRSLGLS